MLTYRQRSDSEEAGGTGLAPFGELERAIEEVAAGRVQEGLHVEAHVGLGRPIAEANTSRAARFFSNTSSSAAVGEATSDWYRTSRTLSHTCPWSDSQDLRSRMLAPTCAALSWRS